MIDCIFQFNGCRLNFAVRLLLMGQAALRQNREANLRQSRPDLHWTSNASCIVGQADEYDRQQRIPPNYSDVQFRVQCARKIAG